MNIINVKVSFDGKENPIHFNLLLENEDRINLDYEQIEGIIKENLLEHMTISWNEKKLSILA